MISNVISLIYFAVLFIINRKKWSVDADLKNVYQAINEDEALNALLEFKEMWQQTYPSCVKSWAKNWDILSTFCGSMAIKRKSKASLALQAIFCLTGFAFTQNFLECHSLRLQPLPVLRPYRASASHRLC